MMHTDRRVCGDGVRLADVAVRSSRCHNYNEGDMSVAVRLPALGPVSLLQFPA